MSKATERARDILGLSGAVALGEYHVAKYARQAESIALAALDYIEALEGRRWSCRAEDCGFEPLTAKEAEWHEASGHPMPDLHAEAKRKFEKALEEAD